MNAKERRMVDIEMNYAFMLGYQYGYKAALPMPEFVHGLMELMDAQKMRKVERWAKKQMEMARQAERTKTALEKARAKPQAPK